MKTLGIRVTPSKIYYSIYDSELKKIDIKIFKKANYLEIPDFLRYVRYNFLDILSSNKINFVTIKKIEPTSKNISFDRIYIEGVIQESLSSSDVIKYFIETKSSFLNHVKKVNSNIKDIKYLLKNKDNFNNFINEFVNINILETTDEESREAILASIFAYKKGFYV